MKNKIKRFFKELWLNWKYRHIDGDICCCGANISEGGYYCLASCRSAKEYTITKALEK